MTETKRFSLVKPTLETPFKIDFDWWKQHDNDYRVYLYGYLCQEHQSAFANTDQGATVDWVDPNTAEVHSVDGLQHVLMSHCAQQPEFVTSNTTLVDSVFRELLAHGNEPMSPLELSKVISRPPETILRTLTGMNYKGIRPVIHR